MYPVRLAITPIRSWNGHRINDCITSQSSRCLAAPTNIGIDGSKQEIAMSLKIRICTKKDAQVLVEITRKSFQDVADRFGLTPENAPRHPSNCTVDWIRNDMEDGVIYYAIENLNHIVGCVALEKANSELCYLERLAVLPNQRRRGFGKALVQHALSEAELLGVNYVSIGIIAEQTELKNWYTGLGFVEGESKEFAHLPFRVTFMSYGINTTLQQCSQQAGAGPCHLY
jgi:N-acetylglutamate synthase-like GNAT family acetyltransferase